MRRFILAGLILLVAAGLWAQSGDQQIVGIETGVVFAYNMDPANEGLGVGQSMTINLTVAPSVQAGFTYVDGDGANMPNQTLLRIHYFVARQIGLSVAAGISGGNAAAGIGIFANAFGQTFQNTLFTAFGIRIDYTLDTTLGLDAGLLTFGLAAKVGM